MTHKKCEMPTFACVIHTFVFAVYVLKVEFDREIIPMVCHGDIQASV